MRLMPNWLRNLTAGFGAGLIISVPFAGTILAITECDLFTSTYIPLALLGLWLNGLILLLGGQLKTAQAGTQGIKLEFHPSEMSPVQITNDD